MQNCTILVIEDESPKRKHIEDFISSRGNGVGTTILRSQSVSSALDVLDEIIPDLIILDMSLPTYEISETESGGRPQGFGGIEILRYLKMSDINCPTLILTGYEAFMREEGLVELPQLSKELKEEFGSFLTDVLYYNSAYSEWKDKMSITLASIGVF